MSFNVLGINFGHDSAITLLREGKIISCQLSERIYRRKQYSGITNELVELFFDQNNINPRTIDFIAVTSTQATPIMVEKGNFLSISVGRQSHDDQKSLCEESIRSTGKSPLIFLAEVIADPAIQPTRQRLIANAKSIDSFRDKPDSSWSMIPMLDYFVTHQEIVKAGLEQIPLRLSRDLETLDSNRFGFHLPLSVTLFGREVPAALIHHHAAHMATAHYLSGFDDSAIVTLDGCVSARQGGWIGVGHKAKILPVNPNFLEVGKLYDRIASDVLNLGSSSSGKMMGLAPYGEPRYFDPVFIGNNIDFSRLRDGHHPVFEGGHPHMSFVYIRYLMNVIRKEQPDQFGLGDPDHATATINL